VTLANEKTGLLDLWEERRVLYEQCMDLQLFNRDTEQADVWMTKQEAFLANDDLGDSLDSVESLMKKHDDFEKSLAAQEEKIKALDEFAAKLNAEGHYGSREISTRRDAVSSVGGGGGDGGGGDGGGDEGGGDGGGGDGGRGLNSTLTGIMGRGRYLPVVMR